MQLEASLESLRVFSIILIPDFTEKFIGLFNESTFKTKQRESGGRKEEREEKNGCELP